jgi:hypothetical protein
MSFDVASLDAPFAALKAYDWGADAASFATIDAAAIAAHADASLQAELEQRLTAILGPGASRAAKEYACRKLMMIGTAASVPALAALLGDKDNSHMARFALERIEALEAAEAMRGALAAAQGDLRIGIVGSLAKRRDVASVPAIAALLAADPKTAAAAAAALGMIASPEAIAALEKADPLAAAPLGPAVADARLACAEALLAGSKRPEAVAVYKSLAAAAAGKPAARLLELAATRGILACTDTTSPS